MNERNLSILAILGIMVSGLASGSELDPDLDIRIEFQNKYSAGLVPDEKLIKLTSRLAEDIP